MGTKDADFRERYGRWAFIAGASVGIGRALSHGAAARGLDVVMVARGKEQLEATAQEVRDRHGVEVRTLATDLASAEIGKVVAEATDGLEVGMLVCNAAVAPPGRFIDVPVEDHLLSIDVNCRTSVILSHHFGRLMAERGRGGISLVSSLAATQGSVNFGTYNSGKAFQWILAESLWAELGESGVDVTTVLVGATSSPNYNSFQETLDKELCSRGDSVDPLDRGRWRLMNPSTPEEVAEALYDQIAAGPTCFNHPTDAWVCRSCLEGSREEAIRVWRGIQETSQRAPERQAR
jgi:short-subunit dehydrogenase